MFNNIWLELAVFVKNFFISQGLTFFCNIYQLFHIFLFRYSLHNLQIRPQNNPRGHWRNPRKSEGTPRANRGTTEGNRRSPRESIFTPNMPCHTDSYQIIWISLILSKSIRKTLNITESNRISLNLTRNFVD